MSAYDVLVNMSVYVDGVSYIGKAQEVTLPKITPKFREYNAGGLGAPIDIPNGQIEKMESDITMGTYDKALFSLLRITPDTNIPLTIRGGIVKSDGNTGQVIVTMRGLINEIDEGTWKPDDDTTVKIGLTLTYYKKEIDNEVIIEIDPINYLMVVNGNDQTAGLRNALGF